MLNRRMLSREEETADDVEVTRKDQDRINRFSTLHQKMALLGEELEKKKQEKEYLTDLTLELELTDEDSLIPYKIGDAFIHIPLSEVQTLLEENSNDIEKEMEKVESRIEKGREEMEELKVELYAKFGKAINLEA